ncbi:RNA polymerase, sigma 54 subunit, RpoN/SigL [Mesobacillus persicus]|uniref:RNA polymerase, sigma 54 subunit, RpoN/SigL n=1 Tax=Mesobacillus persicus TaxID=930146 RepID=A0A1H8A2Q8_9BACI|nr:RNA polymerase factor sigma-54 [Mesobacillus persicus]SEM63827.1 RNA polymerase, sigma 54 subunit, RpoN/SigL [Mesobacillus persicus]
MDLKAGLWQKQTLKLAMTQELTQAIALLQYSAQELSTFLEEKAIENPLLKVEHKNVRSIERMTRSRKSNRPSGSSERDQNWIEQIAEKTDDTLQDYLLFQLNLVPITTTEQNVVRFYIETIDENGYLGFGIEEACAKFKITDQMAESCLKILQGFDPVGVGARNLQECLLLQVEKELSLTDENSSEDGRPPQQLLKTILSDHFILFAEKKWKSIAKMIKMDLKEIQKAFDYVQTLNPRPGSIFQKEKAAYVVPDVIVKLEDGHLTVSLFDDTIPKVTFNEQYFQELASYKDSEVGRFLQDKQNDYQWILKSLEQRRETLMKVALKIVEKQNDFFYHGQSFLRPMTMREVSEELDIHESTVSRAVREKYIQTPNGTYEMRSLFSSSVQTTEDDQTSSNHAKAAIELLIQNENKQKPLSDQDIVHMLENRSGIVISRRTVAKYREQLGIPSSTKRKRFE